MRTRLTSKGRLVLPAELRQLDKLCAGQQFVVERVVAGEYLLKLVPADGEGLLEWLRSCPESGWFAEPLLGSGDTTDSL